MVSRVGEGNRLEQKFGNQTPKATDSEDLGKLYDTDIPVSSKKNKSKGEKTKSEGYWHASLRSFENDAQYRDSCQRQRDTDEIMCQGFVLWSTLSFYKCQGFVLWSPCNSELALIVTSFSPLLRERSTPLDSQYVNVGDAPRPFMWLLRALFEFHALPNTTRPHPSSWHDSQLRLWIAVLSWTHLCLFFRGRQQF